MIYLLIMIQAIFIISVWIALVLIARFLLFFRSDYQRIIRDWRLIRNKQIFGSIVLITLIFLLLPFSIPYSVGNMRQNKRPNR